MTKSYRGSGSASYHPAVLLGIVVYGYATGVFSSRKLERATYDSVAVRFLAANQHPDHDTLATFRRRFLAQIEGLFVQVLGVARAMGVLQLGTVALDGTKIHANASRHSALSYEHATKIEAQLKAEVADLLGKAEAADQAEVPDGMSIPQELALREKRLAAIAKAKATIEARAKERYAREKAEHDAKMAERAAKTAASGRKPSGRAPPPPGGEARGGRAAAAGGWTAADRSGQSDGRRIAHHAGGGRRVRAVLQRPGGGGGGQPARGGHRCGASPQRQGAACADAGPVCRVACRIGQGWRVACGQRLFQRRQRERLCGSRDRAGDRDGTAGASSLAGGAFCRTAAAARGANTARSDAPSASHEARQTALRPAQADAGTGVRHHQVGARVPPVPAARPGQSSRRVEPRDHGVEYEADVRPGRGELSQIACFSARWRAAGQDEGGFDAVSSANRRAAPPRSPKCPGSHPASPITRQSTPTG